VKVSYVLRPHGGENVYLRTFLMQPKNTIDVVYIGGSTCLTNWIPMEAYGYYGFTSFNYGASNMPPQLYKYNIIEALKTQNPDVLVLDITNFGFPELLLLEAAVSYVTDSMRYSFNRISAVHNGMPEGHSRLSYHFDIAKHHSLIENVFSKNNWKYAFNIPDDNTKYYGGFRPVIAYEEIERTDNSSITEEQQFSEDMLRIYNDLVYFCSRLDASVLFVVAPIDETENQRREFNFAKRIAEGQGITFFNINDIINNIGIDAITDFYNNRHMQIYGAEKYTRWLAKYLVDNNNLADRRGDPGYVDWETVYELWEPEKARIEQGVFALMPKGAQDTLSKIK